MEKLTDKRYTSMSYLIMSKNHVELEYCQYHIRTQCKSTLHSIKKF